MRIVFVQAGLGPGGAEKIVNLLAGHRLTLGDEVHVLAFSDSCGGSYFPYDESISIETLESADYRGPRGFARIAKRLAWLHRRLSTLQPDLTVSFLTKTNVLTLLATRGLSSKVIVSERNNPSRQEAHPVWRPAGILLASFADNIVMQTDAAYKSLPSRLRARATVIPNPCIVPREIRKFRGNGQRIIAVGRLCRQKGFDLLIEAFSRIVGLAPQATLTIHGEGPERESLEKMVHTLGIADRVRLPGVTTTPGGWLGTGDIFVLSSRFEGFPNVLVEALAAGYAAIAFDCPWGPSEILSHGRNGILVPPEDVGALADALAHLLTDSERRLALSTAAPLTVKDFSLQNILERWDAAFSNAVGH